MKKLLYLLVLLSFSSLYAQVRFYDVQTLSNYQQILMKSLQEDKLMFIAFYRNGDDFYRMQKEDIFASPLLDSIYEQTVPMAIGITSEMGSRLAQSIGVDSFPSFYYFNNEETLLLVKSGYQTEQNLADALNQALELNQQYLLLKDKYTTGKLSPSEWHLLIEIYSLNHGFIESLELALEYFNSQERVNLIKPENAPLLEKYGIDLESVYPKVIIANKDKLGDEFDLKEFYNSAYDYNFDLALTNSDTVLLEKIITELIPNRPKDEADIRELSFETRKVFASETRNFRLWEFAAITRSETLENDSIKAEFLFGEAFEIADNFNIKAAQTAARSLSKRAFDLREDFRYKMLEGYMAYLMQDYENAKVLVETAASKTDNPNNIRKADSLKRMIEKELPQTDEDEDQ